MKKNILIFIFFIFVFCFIFSFYKIKALENKNFTLNKKINILKEKENWYKGKSIFYKDWYLLIESDFFKNYEENLSRFKKYLKEIANNCNSKKVCINLVELDISFSNKNDIEKFLNDFSLKNVYKLKISSISITKEWIEKIFENLNHEKLEILHLGIERIKWEILIWYIKNFINTKKDINLLETLIIENIWKDNLNNSDILSLASLKVEKIEFLWYPISLNEILNILQNSEYLNRITVTDWINYNWKKAFYFVKRNWKTYIYDNAWNKLN